MLGLRNKWACYCTVVRTKLLPLSLSQLPLRLKPPTNDLPGCRSSTHTCKINGRRFLVYLAIAAAAAAAAAFAKDLTHTTCTCCFLASFLSAPRALY